MQPPGLHKARNAEQLLAYNADAFAAAAPNDIGALGDCECTHCGAQLWPAEATKVPPSARGYFGSDHWHHPATSASCFEQMVSSV